MVRGRTVAGRVKDRGVAVAGRRAVAWRGTTARIAGGRATTAVGRTAAALVASAARGFRRMAVSHAGTVAVLK